MDLFANQRVLKLISEKNLSYKKFATIVGIKHQNITQWKDNSSVVSPRVLCRIIKHFSDINARWLITGMGEMLVEEDYSGEHENKDANTVMEKVDSYKTENDFLKERIKYLENSLDKKDELLKTMVEKLNS